MKANGYLTSMTQFSMFFGLKLSYLIFLATEQLSLTLQGKILQYRKEFRLLLSLWNIYKTKELMISTMLFTLKVLADSKDLTSEPVLPCQRRHPRKIDSNSAGHDLSPTLESSIYYEALDTVTTELKHRLCQEHGMPVAAKLEKLLVSAANTTINRESDITDIYSKDLDAVHLATQLQILPQLLHTCSPQSAVQRITNVRALCDIMNKFTVSYNNV